MITDNRAEQAIIAEIATDRGYRKKEIRSYEISLWTLQDSFITVLKWSDIEQLGRVENAKMKLNIDGTESLTFTIPMYIMKDGICIDNPSWYTVRDNQLIKNMRKIKVVFNKGESREQIFEFLIVDVTEEHESDSLICSVTCEGLAFNELGKIGYQYSLSPEIFYEEMEEWFKTQIGEKPVQNIDYWCQQIDLEKLPTSQSELAKCNARTWYYEVRMNWSAYDGGVSRDTHKIYEEAYASEWNPNLEPIKIESAREKERPISVEKSNLYNITQTIAETFGIFCKYEYLHNANQQIVGRRIIFYNNFFSEESGMITFNYPHYTNKISRKTDSAELTTKLYVSDVETEDTYEGLYSIMNAEANASHENYIMNFDYMLENGAISQDQYDEILPYLQEMKRLNEELTRLQNNRNEYEQRIPKLEAEIAMCNKNITTATEQRNQNTQLQARLGARDGNNDGLIEVDASRPDSTVIVNAGNGKGYIKLDNTNKGIISGSIHIYSQYNTTNHTIITNSEIKDFKVETDEYGYVNTLYDILYPAGSSVVYLTYKYNPFLYYDTIIKIWDTVLGENIQKRNELQITLGTKDSTGAGISGLYLILTNTQNAITSKLEEKKAIQKAFERLMGPALREGYWQPDDYAEFGDQRESIFQIADASIDSIIFNDDTKRELVLGWDSQLFEDEDKLNYQVGMTSSNIEYYPCINLAPLFNESSFINALNTYKLTDYSVTFVNNQIETLSGGQEYRLKNRESYKIGSEAILHYVQYNNRITPILVLVGAKKLTTDQLRWLYGDSLHPQSSYSRPALAIIDDTKDTDGFLVLDVNTTGKYYSLAGQSYWINNLFSTDVHASISARLLALRMKCSSLDLKTDASSLSIKYVFDESQGVNGQIILAPYEHYYINTRNTNVHNNTTNEDEYRVEQYITIKPEILITHQKTGYFIVEYIISNASLAIYQDAVQVLKENSKPKVSYEIAPTILNTDLTNHLYNTLAQIVMINDTDLKLVNTFGYISELELDLDNVANDSVVIQNYTSKFEDLFSSIVTSTESMQRSQGTVSAAANGNIPLSAAGLANTFDGNTTILQAYLNSYFDSSEIVEKKLQSLFTEAAGILGDANQSLNYTRALTEENAAILSTFSEKAQESMRTKVYTSVTKPLHFKIGDVWTYTDGGVTYTYVAITNSENVTNNTGTEGFTRTYDGSLAQITGTALNVDAVSGKVNITATNEINLLSGGDVKIAANENIYIHGNKKVDISGATINLTTNVVTTDNNYNAGQYGSINLMATGYANNYDTAYVSRINIDPTHIFMAGSEIEILTGATAGSTSAMKLDSTGVRIASTGSISLFSGALGNTTTAGGSVMINHEHVYLSYYNADNNLASNIALDVNGIILAAGTAAQSANVGSTSGLTGAKITKESIGLAVGSGTTRSAFLMNENGLTIGSGSFNVASNPSEGTTGSYVKISGSGIDLGSTANLYINANNFKLQTKSTGTIFAIGSDLNGISASTNPSTLNADSTVNFLVNQNGAYIKGQVYATGGSFSGAVYATSFQLASGQTIPYSQISDTPTIPDPADFTINGISGPVTWNGKSYEVALTSNDGLLIGTNSAGQVNNSGITIARDASNAAVQIDKDKIEFRTATSQVIINANGIYMSGGTIDLHTTSSSRIRINGEEIWGRDNILYGPNEAEVEAIHQNSGYTGDWIWIKPDSTTAVSYVQPAGSNNSYENAVGNTVQLNESGNRTLSDSSSSTFTYAISCRCESTDTSWHDGGQRVTLTVYNGDKTRSTTVTQQLDFNINKVVRTTFNFSLSGNSTSVANNLANLNKMYISASGCDDVCNFTVTVSSPGGSGSNLCTVYYKH